MQCECSHTYQTLILKHRFLKKWKLRQNLRFESAKVKEFILLASPGFC